MSRSSSLICVEKSVVECLSGLPRNQERTERTLELTNADHEEKGGRWRRCRKHQVTDEEDGEGDDEGKWVVRPPAWRSREASDLMQRLQAKVDRLNKRPKVFRVRGDNSNRGRPSATTTWAVRRVASTPTKSPAISRRRVAIDPADMSPTAAVRRAVLSPTPSNQVAPLGTGLMIGAIKKQVSIGTALLTPSPTSSTERIVSRSASPVFLTISTPTSSINRLG
ncbi:hypothetical protein AC249_AIPGENE22933, partial [Exaiptasia diaphana]